jgi:alpha-L-fucosidase
MNRAIIKKITSIIFLIAVISCNSGNESQPDIAPNSVIPSISQIAYQEMEMVGFIHFTINTFTGKEWGYGNEDPSLFNPGQIDVEQWVIAAKSGGLKELILTAKHHDGFCLWPSKFTEHSIKNSPYKNGKGDIVREFVEASREHGLKVGLYLSPWDRNHKDYGTPAYIDYYRNQIIELLTQYGEINEIWFDGANGGDGFYGGSNEVRRIDAKTYYDWNNTIALVKELQPGISIFSDAGPDIRWVGNEKGHAGVTFWSTINRDKIIIGKSDQQYLNKGEPEGKDWVIGQCDVSVRPGWFYHKDEDSLLKSPQDLIDIYYKSVGRNSVLLLNLPPDTRGLIHDNDLASLKAFKQIIDESFEINLAEDGICMANNYRLKNNKFSPQNVLDNSNQTYWATDDLFFPAELMIALDKEVLFDRILIQEPIRLGQRISNFQLEVQIENKWITVFEGTTIGYKRLIRIAPVSTSKIRLKINDANNTVAISNFGIYKASERENQL